MTIKEISSLPFPVRYIKTTEEPFSGHCLCVNGEEIIDLRNDNHIQHDSDMGDSALADYYYSQYDVNSWEPCSKYGHSVY